MNQTTKSGLRPVLLVLLPLFLSQGALAQPMAAPASDSPGKELGRKATAQFYAGELDALWDRFSQKMKDVLKAKDTLKAFRQQIDEQLGTEVAVIDEVDSQQGEIQAYVRTVRFSKAPTPIVVQFAFGAKGSIEGFAIRPQMTEAPTRFLDYETKTPLRLPFDGEWTVFWGGRTIAQNYHTITRDQRFAYDIVIFKNGVSHSGEGKGNEDYYAFGQTLVAPAAGTVVEAVDGIDDNVPGQMNARQPAGNHLILDHGNGEFSLLAHFKKGSLRVKKGDVVKAGDPLGLCGNSGNSSEPHLHYHLQNAGTFGQGEGLPAKFLHYKLGGQVIERGEPVKGEAVQNVPAAPANAANAAKKP